MDPPPLLSLRTTTNNKNKNKNTPTIAVPRVGYSFYKTPPQQPARCTTLALAAGTRHLDLATSYHSNTEPSAPLRRYLSTGILPGLDDESTELREYLTLCNNRIERTSGGGGAGARTRRESLFLSHKLSNEEQSVSPSSIRRSITETLSTLGTDYLDCVSIHSPLADFDRWLGTYFLHYSYGMLCLN